MVTQNVKRVTKQKKKKKKVVGLVIHGQTSAQIALVQVIVLMANHVNDHGRMVIPTPANNSRPRNAALIREKGVARVG